ncbi:MAG TPA: hypothetical protein DIS95_03640 [Proteus vulgaris]|uniref:hypothetical protein n=1 Tax=Proteus terrae TaxID=1574161 RepID=UPI000EDDDB78|nr:hypothetical protein [Proteus terrae]HCN41493.1 hypothetical protein [Proteus vulgaris]
MKSIIFYETNRHLNNIIKMIEPIKKIKKTLLYLPAIYGVLSIIIYCNNNNIKFIDLINIKIITTIGIFTIVFTFIYIIYTGLCFLLALENEKTLNKDSQYKNLTDISKIIIYLSISACIYNIINYDDTSIPLIVIIISLFIIPAIITLKKSSKAKLYKIAFFLFLTTIIIFIYLLILYSLTLVSNNSNNESFHYIIFLYGILYLALMIIMTSFKDKINSSIFLFTLGIILLTPVLLQSNFQIKASGIGYEYRCYSSNEITSLGIPKKFTTPISEITSKVFILAKTDEIMYIKKDSDSKESLRITTLPKMEFTCVE